MALKEHYKAIKSLKISEKKKKLLRLIARYVNVSPLHLKLFCRISKNTKGITIYSDIEESFVVNLTWKDDKPILDISYLDSGFFKIVYNLMFEIDCWIYATPPFP
jgi:hypothetical protein